MTKNQGKNIYPLIRDVRILECPLIRDFKPVFHSRQKRRAQKKEFKYIELCGAIKTSAQGRLRNNFPQPIKLQEKSERGAFCANGKRALLYLSWQKASKEHL